MSVRCGYPEGVSINLASHDNDPVKIEQLINLGDIATQGTA